MTDFQNDRSTIGSASAQSKPARAKHWKGKKIKEKSKNAKNPKRTAEPEKSEKSTVARPDNPKSRKSARKSEKPQSRKAPKVRKVQEKPEKSKRRKSQIRISLRFAAYGNQRLLAYLGDRRFTLASLAWLGWGFQSWGYLKHMKSLQKSMESACRCFASSY